MTGGTLDGRRVLVVGAGTRPSPDGDDLVGNGRAIAVTAGRAGAIVACADVDEEAAAHTAALGEAEGATAVVLTARGTATVSATLPITVLGSGSAP